MTQAVAPPRAQNMLGRPSIAYPMGPTTAATNIKTSTIPRISNPLIRMGVPPVLGLK
jgi:hypothetical protein